jgi:hypothetical protein
LIKQIRVKNRTRFVTAAFKGKFLRKPNLAELSHWVAIFQVDADFQRFLRQIAQMAASDQPLLGGENGRILSTDSATLDLAAAKKTGLTPLFLLYFRHSNLVPI